MTKTVLDNGDIATATLRKPSALDDLRAKYPPSKLHILKLDVTDKDSIAAAFKYAEEELGHNRHRLQQRRSLHAGRDRSNPQGCGKECVRRQLLRSYERFQGGRPFLP